MGRSVPLLPHNNNNKEGRLNYNYMKYPHFYDKKEWIAPNGEYNRNHKSDKDLTVEEKQTKFVNIMRHQLNENHYDFAEKTCSNGHTTYFFVRNMANYGWFKIRVSTHVSGYSDEIEGHEWKSRGYTAEIRSDMVTPDSKGKIDFQRIVTRTIRTAINSNRKRNKAIAWNKINQDNNNNNSKKESSNNI